MIKKTLIIIDNLSTNIVGAYLIFVLFFLPFEFHSFSLISFIGVYSFIFILLTTILLSLKFKQSNILLIIRRIITYGALLSLLIGYYQWSLTGFDHL